VSDRPDGVAGNLLGATIAGLVLFVVGLAVGVGVLESDRRERQRLEGAVRTEGTVIAQIKLQTADGTAYAPVIAFSTGSGERVSFTAHATDPSKYWLGAKVPVRYEPGNPAGAQIDSSTLRLIRNLLGGAGSLLVMSLGAYIAWYARRAEARAALDNTSNA
jgi:hypothetical protein